MSERRENVIHRNLNLNGIIRVGVESHLVAVTIFVVGCANGLRDDDDDRTRIYKRKFFRKKTKKKNEI